MRQPSSLRAKTILVVTLTLLALLGVQWLLLSTIAEEGFSTLERRQMRADVGRVQAALDAELDQLSTQVSDYALWDDAYAFVQDRNADYIKSNLYDKALVDLKLNLVIYVDITGDIVFAKAVDLVGGSGAPLPAALMAPIRAGESPLAHPPPPGRDLRGVIALPDGLVLVAARPILMSDGRGPAAGTLVFGRYLDARKQQQLSSLTHLPFAIHDIGAHAGDHDLDAEQAAIDQPESVQVTLPAADLIVGYTALSDISQRPVALLRVETPRSVSQEGRRVITAVGASLALAGVVFLAVMLWAIELGGLRRLARLSRSVEAIGSYSDPAQRVLVSGSDELGRLATAINTMLDALEQAQSERLLAVEERARIEHERAAIEAKRDLLGVVSHEMRTPLTPIRGYTDLLLMPDGDPLTADQREYVQAIRTSATYLGLLIEDLLELSRLESTDVKLVLRPVALPDVVAEVVDLLRPAIERKRINLRVELPPSLPVIEADRKRLTQVLVNLVSNATKYTYNEGSICLSVDVADDRVALEVADSGVGLDPEQLRRLFTRFYRADNALSYEAGGTGLGLAIAHAFVVLHGGTISVRSQQGVGSVFRVELPVRQPCGDALPAPAAVPEPALAT